MTALLLLLVIVSYLLGALPLAYLAARSSRGIDLRKYGTGQVGTGNLFRMTSSKRLSLPVAIFDFGKGAFMVCLAGWLGLGIAGQVAVGLATVAGHNWSVFLRFSGRGVGTAIGLVVALPLVSGSNPWGIAAFVGVGVLVLLITRSTPLPVLAALVALPLATWLSGAPLALSLGFLALLVLIAAKRLWPGYEAAAGVSRCQLVLYRLLFDRDIKDRKAWMYRKPSRDQVT